MEYDNEGYLPEAMINYLARLGWSHGDDELFSREQLVSWFDTRHLSKSASQWDPKKLNWVNAHYIKQMDDAELAERVARARAAATRKRPTCPASWACSGPRRNAGTARRRRHAVLRRIQAGPAELAEQHLTPAAREALADFAQRAQGTEWTREALSALIKAVLADRGLKMPQLAIPLRVAVVGQTQTPAVDAVLALLGKETVLARLASV